MTRSDTRLSHPLRPISAGGPAYHLRLADGPDDLRAAQALRFRVFNLELGEGLTSAWQTGLDADPFDAVCDHLIVEDARAGTIVGTYRMLTGARAAQPPGWYGAREFDFTPFEPVRASTLELGRACIDVDHRSFAVLNLLWSGIAAYAQRHGARYLVGCSSLTSTDPAEGAAAWARLREHLAPSPFRTAPQAAFACPLEVLAPVPPKVPKLLATYLALGARLCGPPAIDREFGTIDFLTWLDLEDTRMKALLERGRFAAPR